VFALAITTTLVFAAFNIYQQRETKMIYHETTGPITAAPDREIKSIVPPKVSPPTRPQQQQPAVPV